MYIRLLQLHYCCGGAREVAAMMVQSSNKRCSQHPQHPPPPRCTQVRCKECCTSSIARTGMNCAVPQERQRGQTAKGLLLTVPAVALPLPPRHLSPSPLPLPLPPRHCPPTAASPRPPEEAGWQGRHRSVEGAALLLPLPASPRLPQSSPSTAGPPQKAALPGPASHPGSGWRAGRGGWQRGLQAGQGSRR